MTKQEALKKLEEGETLTHYNFASYESIRKDGDEYVFEDGVRCPIPEFWRWRTVPSWNDYWELKQIN